MTELDTVRQLYDFNRWANERTLAAAADLSAEQYARDVGSSFPSLKATLEHLFQVDGIWLSRFRLANTRPPQPPAVDLPRCSSRLA